MSLSLFTVVKHPATSQPTIKIPNTQGLYAFCSLRKTVVRSAMNMYAMANPKEAIAIEAEGGESKEEYLAAKAAR